MRLEFRTKEEFLEKLKNIDKSKIEDIITPHWMHELDEYRIPAKKLESMTFIGSITGLMTGFAFTILTSLVWNLWVGGKAPASVTPYFVIAYELTILFGSITAFVFYALIKEKKEEDGKYVIITHE